MIDFIKGVCLFGLLMVSFIIYLTDREHGQGFIAAVRGMDFQDRP